ncbi:MAG: hypothetical protein ACT4NX_03755 [Deltaproteobacteria bacterium]
MAGGGGEVKFQKLRADIAKKLRPVKLVLVNANVFPRNDEQSAPPPEIAEMARMGVQVSCFSNGEINISPQSLKRLGVETECETAASSLEFYTGIKVLLALSDSQIAFLGRDFFDMPIIERAAFAVATADAALEVKAKSYYAAYGVGAAALGELADLILRAKRASHSGFSK